MTHTDEDIERAFEAGRRSVFAEIRATVLNEREYEARMRKLALDVKCWMAHPRLGLLLELEDE